MDHAKDASILFAGACVLGTVEGGFCFGWTFGGLYGLVFSRSFPPCLFMNFFSTSVEFNPAFLPEQEEESTAQEAQRVLARALL